MTQTATNARVEYTGNNSTTAFAMTFPITASSDVSVYVDGVLKTITTHYTVAVTSYPGTGTITFTSGNTPGTGAKVLFIQNVPLTQPVDYVAFGAFTAATNEGALDRNTMHSIRREDKLDTKFGVTDTMKVSDRPTMTIADVAADRANKVLAFDSSGDISATQEIGVFQGNWAASTAYVLRDLVKDTSNNNIYICIVAHTSSGSQPISSNADAAKWTLIIDAAAVAASASAAATSATAAATSATAAATSATAAATSATASATSATASAGSATTASTQATNAASSASTASTQASNASTSATNAATSATNAEASAGALAWKYTFDNSTTMADPGTGDIRFNHGTLGSITAIAIDATSADTGNPDVSDLIASIDDGTNSTHEGYVFARKSGAPATFLAFNVTGAITDNTGWLQIPVTTASSGGSLSASDVLYISFTRSGNVGATGPQGIQGIQGIQGATGPQGEATIGDIIALG